MIKIFVPGFKHLHLEHLVLDYNGTIACDGRLLNGLKELLAALADHLQVHVLTADTFGNVEKELSGLPVTVSILPPGNQDNGKLEYLHKLGPDRCVCIGNGRNDRLMLQAAELGIALIQAEGASAATISAADVVCKDITAALDLLIHPKRLVATLRN